ncbi:cell division protein ZapB [Candidatus Binatia bacterium]|nr:cell division protein ZapB [Candidatus Binatia bacterium]
MSLDSLKVLEARIGQFVDQHRRAKDEQAALAERVREQERQLAEVAAQLKRYELERAEIKARLERILSRLDGLDLA